MNSELLLEDSKIERSVKKWLTGIFSDPMTKILVKNSHLTKTQVETFLIDILAEKIAGKKLGYEQKAKLRPIASGVTRGSFNRTLAQARRNIIKSIYTIILLGYLGVLETPCLDPYFEIATKIRTYTEAYTEALKSKRPAKEHIRVIRMLQEQLEQGLQLLSKPANMSKRM